MNYVFAVVRFILTSIVALLLVSAARGLHGRPQIRQAHRAHDTDL